VTSAYLLEFVAARCHALVPHLPCESPPPRKLFGYFQVNTPANFPDIPAKSSHRTGLGFYGAPRRMPSLTGSCARAGRPLYLLSDLYPPTKVAFPAQTKSGYSLKEGVVIHVCSSCPPFLAFSVLVLFLWRPVRKRYPTIFPVL